MGLEMTLFRALPSQERLLELLDYDPADGLLFWKPRNSTAMRNNSFAGREAFTAVANGYRTGSVDGVTYRAHRIIWKIVYGSDPEDIDHINGDRQDNRLANLRSVSRSDNMRNAQLRSNNSSGVVGVTYNRERRKWVAQIKDGKQRVIGRFDSFDEAVSARQSAEREAGFHANHGRAPRRSAEDTRAALHEWGWRNPASDGAGR